MKSTKYEHSSNYKVSGEWQRDRERAQARGGQHIPADKLINFNTPGVVHIISGAGTDRVFTRYVDSRGNILVNEYQPHRGGGRASRVSSRFIPVASSVPQPTQSTQPRRVYGGWQPEPEAPRRFYQRRTGSQGLGGGRGVRKKARPPARRRSYWAPSGVASAEDALRFL